MKIFHGVSIALCAAGMFVMNAALPVVAADQAPVVKAPVVAAIAVVCSNLNWTHGWLDHGGWGGWGYEDGLVVNDWYGSCDSALAVGPYAYAPRESHRDRAKR